MDLAGRFCAMVCLAFGSGAAMGAMMIEAPDKARMVEVAASELGLSAHDVAIKSNAELDRAGCVFFVGTSTAQPVHQVSNFATLDGGRIAGVDVRGNEAAAALLKICGADADAVWWAAVIARFSSDVSGLVLTADGNPFAVRKVRESGATFSRPTLTRSGGASTVSFFVMDMALNRVSRIQATLDASGKLVMDRKVLVGAPAVTPAQ